MVSYVYDAYGRVVSIDGSLASTLGHENPFRYRSYYFDSESGYYYLQSRYYSPEIGRFINADSQINPEVNGGNVFAYCGNNPVNQTDPDGHWSISNTIKVALTMMKVISAIVKIKKAYDDVKSSIINGAKATIKRISSSKIAKDIKNFSINNSNANKVIDANIISAYKGTVVIKSSILNEAAFSYGAMFIGDNVSDSNTINHEYGHTVQLKNMGQFNYTRFVFIPSVTFFQFNIPKKLKIDYYSSPWEYQADLYGGVERFNYESWADDVNRYYPK